jgi:hypothetical protein
MIAKLSLAVDVIEDRPQAQFNLMDVNSDWLLGKKYDV